MAIARAGTTHQQATAQASGSLTRPTSAAGNLLLATVAVQGLRTIATPAGWTLLEHNQGSDFTVASWWRIDDGSAGPFAVTWDGGGTPYAWWRVTSYSGAHASAPISAGDQQANASSATVAGPSITPADADCLLLGIFTGNGSTTATWTPPAGYTSFDAQANGVLAAEKQLAGGAGTPTGAISATISAARPNACLHVAIRPAAVAPIVPNKAIRVRTSDGWQDVALQGPPGPPASPTTEQVLAVPQLFMRGDNNGGTAFHVLNIYWLVASNGGILAPANDTQLVPTSRRAILADLDVVPGYKPQVRLVTTMATNATDPGTGTFTMGLTSVQQSSGGAPAAGGASNRRFGVSGTLAATARANVAASSTYEDASAWGDLTAANMTACGLVGDRLGVYWHTSATPVSNSMVSLAWQVEIRWIPE